MPMTPVKLNGDKLIIGQDVFTTKNIDTLPPALHPHTIFTPTDDKTVAFFTKQSEFSNHAPCEFDVNGVKYNSGEQWLMAQKADLFKDNATLEKIMNSTDPVHIKALGRNIQNYKEEVWYKEAPALMQQGLEAKFIQNQKLGTLLKETGTKLIIEASTDKFWGAGVTLRSKDLFINKAWTGSNTLGKSLMAVREIIKSG